jgi:NADH dehydrogenase
MTEKPTRRPRVLIVGAGFGGLTKRLAGQPVDVTIIDQRNYHLFRRWNYRSGFLRYGTPVLTG